MLLVMVTKEMVEGSEDLRKIVSDGSVVHPQFFEKRLTHFAQRVFRYFLVCQIAKIDQKKRFVVKLILFGNWCLRLTLLNINEFRQVDSH